MKLSTDEMATKFDVFCLVVKDGVFGDVNRGLTIRMKRNRQSGRYEKICKEARQPKM